jgi:hypothetical protein
MPWLLIGSVTLKRIVATDHGNGGDCKWRRIGFAIHDDRTFKLRGDSR